jgi:hypothetical protein
MFKKHIKENIKVDLMKYLSLPLYNVKLNIYIIMM